MLMGTEHMGLPALPQTPGGWASPEIIRQLEHIGISLLDANKVSLALFETRCHEGRREQGQDLIFLMHEIHQESFFECSELMLRELPKLKSSLQREGNFHTRDFDGIKDLLLQRQTIWELAGPLSFPPLTQSRLPQRQCEAQLIFRNMWPEQEELLRLVHANPGNFSLSTGCPFSLPWGIDFKRRIYLLWCLNFPQAIFPLSAGQPNTV